MSSDPKPEDEPAGTTVPTLAEVVPLRAPAPKVAPPRKAPADPFAIQAPVDVSGIVCLKTARAFYTARFVDTGPHGIRFQGSSKRVRLLFEHDWTHCFSRQLDDDVDPSTVPMDELIPASKRDPFNRRFNLERARCMNRIFPTVKYPAFVVEGKVREGRRNILVCGPVVDGWSFLVCLRPAARGGYTVVSAYPIPESQWTEHQKHTAVALEFDR